MLALLVPGVGMGGGVASAAPAITAAADQPSGGYLWPRYEIELARRRAEKRARDELEEESRAIQDETDREIALILRDQEAKDARRAELERLRELVTRSATEAQMRELGERVFTAYQRAITKHTFSAAEALERELDRALEEEQFLLLAAQLLLGMH